MCWILKLRGEVLDTPQMYEAVKKYETYMACNKRLEGQSSSPSAGQQKHLARLPTINRASIDYSFRREGGRV